MGSDAQHLERLEALVRRDRNHPSVAIWSLGNEEFGVEETPAGGRVAATMQALVKRLDPTRPVTFNAPVGNEFTGINEAIEVRGWSYHVGGDMDAYHREHPRQPNVGSEQGSTVGTRGIYENDPVRGYVSAYDDNAPAWAQTAETWVTFFASRPWLSGGFVWTGFDYRGEPTPYAWPCISSHFGILDTCGFPKDNFWYYKSWWTDQPVVHLLPHWNWPGREGQEIDVRALSNCDEVELSLNGRPLGRQAMAPHSELKWKVPYAAGVLSARGFRAGRLVAEDRVETTGAAAAVSLRADRAEIDADGRDLSVVTVSIVDAQGRVVPVAGNAVSFDVEGPARILGVGNGDPSCHEPDTVVPAAQSHTFPIEGWRWGRVPDSYPADLPEEGEHVDDSGWELVDISGAVGQLGLRGRAIYRAHVLVTPAQAASPVSELWLGRVAGGVAVYVNGRRVGGPTDSGSASVYDVKALIHPGDNTIAVAAANNGPEMSGMSGGAFLRLQDEPARASWARSTFNGLAQLLVQSTGQPGAIRVTARSEGLQPTVAALVARPSAPMPSVP